MAGLHSWTDDDFPNVANWGISTFSPTDLATSSAPLLEWLASTGCHKIAIHLDVDVVDSNEVIWGLGPEPDGLTSQQVKRLISDLSQAGDVVGMTIAEFIPRQVIALQEFLSGMPLV